MYIPICAAMQKSLGSHSMKFSVFVYGYSQALSSILDLFVDQANSLKASSLGNSATHCFQDVHC